MFMVLFTIEPARLTAGAGAGLEDHQPL